MFRISPADCQDTRRSGDRLVGPVERLTSIAAGLLHGSEPPARARSRFTRFDVKKAGAFASAASAARRT
jgi:hypothetical protein